MVIRCRGDKVRYRFKTTKAGVKQRLAFCGNVVKEIKTFGNSMTTKMLLTRR